MKPLKILGLFPALILAAPLWADDQAQLTAVPRPVVTEILTAGPIEGSTFIGEIEATTTVGVASEVLGRLIARPVSEGETVRRGQVLAQIDAKSLIDDRNAARAGLASAEATLSSAEHAQARTAELVRRGTASPSDRETAERNASVARAAVDQARAGLARAEDALSRAVVLAPMDGIVIATRYDPGTIVAAGDPILVLASPAGRNVVLTLPATLLQDMPLGAPFVIHAPKLPEGGITGRLLRVDPVSIAETRMRVARIELGPEAEPLAIGELVEVTPVGQARDAVTVPLAAIWQKDGRSFVWRINRSQQSTGIAEKIEITPGAVQAGRMAVTGVVAGDEVVTRGIASLSAGKVVGAATTASPESQRNEIRPVITRTGDEE